MPVGITQDFISATDEENINYVVANFAGRSMEDLIPIIQSSWAVPEAKAREIYVRLVEPRLREFTPESSTVGVDLFYGEGLDVVQGDLSGSMIQELAATTPFEGTPSQPAQGLPMGGAAIAAAAGALALLPRAGMLTAMRTLATNAGLRGAAFWNWLPGPVKAVLATVGIAGATIGMDWPFGDDDDSGFELSRGTVDTGDLQYVGTWTANGIRFYRLVDGKIAVQRKNGTWKVWRPKKPIVLYSDGADNLKTLLKADRALDRQSKRLRKMLDRRAPRRRSTTRTRTQLPAGQQIITTGG